MTEFFTSWLSARRLVTSPRLTGGLYAVLRALDAKRVILPGNCCLNVVYATVLAGAEPILCEIDPSHGGPSVEACAALMAGTKVDAVVDVHLYGRYHDRGPMYRLCREHGALYFEDAALWFPPERGYEVLPGACLGLSFGKQKTFDFGGGALVAFADDALADEVVAVQAHAPARGPDRWSEYSRAFHAAVSAEWRPKRPGISFATFAHDFRDQWIGACALPDITLDEARVRSEYRRRTQLARAYQQVLARRGYKLFDAHPLDFPWRLTFFADDADRLASDLQRHRIAVSRFYRPLELFFPDAKRSATLDHSRRLGDRACNLPLDATVTEASVRQLENAFARRDYERTWPGRVETSLRRGVRLARRVARGLERRLRS